MQSANVKQFNMGYTKFPTAMLAKLPKDAREDGAVNFVPNTGARRFKANQLGILSVTHKYRSTYSSLIKLPHYVYERELGLSHSTVNRNLALLREQNILVRKENVSDYYIDPKIEFSEKSYVVVYSFLNEKLQLGGKCDKKLTFNAVLLLSFMLNHYFSIKKSAGKNGRNNIKPEEAFFIGGKQRLASLLNVAESTANDAVWELMNVGAIYRKAYCIDNNYENLVSDGKGNSRSLLTCYILNSKLIRMAERVHARVDNAHTQKIERADKQAQREERQRQKELKRKRKTSENSGESDKTITQTRTYGQSKAYTAKAAQRQRDNKVFASLYAAEPPEPPDPFEEFGPLPDNKNN